MSYDRKQIILERNERSEGLGGKYVDLYEFPDGTLEVRSKGHLLPYRLFSKDPYLLWMSCGLALMKRTLPGTLIGISGLQYLSPSLPI
jgi:hypothetical protein